MEIVTLALFSVVALYKVYADEPKGSIKPALSWINPFDDQQLRARSPAASCSRSSSTGAGTPRVSVNEETENGSQASGQGGGRLRRFILLGIYVVVAAAAQAFGGTQSLIDNQATCSRRSPRTCSARRWTSS